MDKNWRTTAGGIVGGFGAALTTYSAFDQGDGLMMGLSIAGVGAALTAFGMLALGLHARDKRVTSEGTIIPKDRMKRSGLLAILMALILGAALAVSCAGMQKLDPPSIEYVKADVQFDAVFGERIEEWIGEDRTMTTVEKDALDLALQAWRAMVTRAAAANGIEQ